jgi:hypothetical protein
MLKRTILIATGLALFVGLIVAYMMLCANYSDGIRVGTIVKFTKKGVIFKTHEGRLQQGSSNEFWDFTVESDTAVLNTIERANDHGNRVKMYYHEKYYQFDWRGDTKYIVYKVETVH